MTTNETIIPMGSESSAPKRSRTHKIVTIGGATAVAVAAVSALFVGLDATTAAPAERTPGAQMTLDQALHDLAVNGPRTREAVEPAPRTMDQKLQDLVDRGLIPRQALEPAVAESESIIFGPAHPLGAPDIGIPCASRVFTRC
jgi:hypothetical protein